MPRLNPLPSDFAEIPDWLSISIPNWTEGCSIDDPLNISITEPADWLNLYTSDLKEADKFGEGNAVAAGRGCDAAAHAWRSLPAQKRYRYELSDAAFRAVYCVREYGTEKDDIRNLAKRPRVITPDDIHASRIVIHSALRAELWKLAKKKRLRNYTADWTIIKLIIRDHMTMRDVAIKVGLEKTGSTVTQIFNDAVAAIVESIGTFSTDLSVPRKEWSRPRLREQNAPFVKYTQSAWYADRPAPRIINKGFSLWPKARRLTPGQIDEKDRLIAKFLSDGGEPTQCRPGRAFYYKGILGSGRHAIYVSDVPVELSGSNNRIDFYIDDAPVARVITVPAMPRGIWTGNIPTAAQVIGHSWTSKQEGKPHKIKSRPFTDFYVWESKQSGRLYVRDCGRNYPRNGVTHPLEKLVVFNWYFPLREREARRRMKQGRPSSVSWGLTDQQYELIKSQAADRLASKKGQPAGPASTVDDDDAEPADGVMDVAKWFEQEEAKAERGFLAEDPPF